MEAKFNNISNIYSVFEILKDVKVDQVMNFSKSGIKIKDISTDKILVFEFNIEGKNLVEYKYDGTVKKVGFSTLYLCQVLKMIEKDTLMSLKINSGLTNKIIIVSKNQNCTKESTFEIDTNDFEDSETQQMSINNLFYITMKTDEFYKTISHYKNFGNSVVTLICSENVFRIESIGQSIKTKQEYGYDSKCATENPDGIQIKYLGDEKGVKQTMATYSIDSILKFKKCTKLGPKIEIYISDKNLLWLSHDVGNIGKLKTIISPTSRCCYVENNEDENGDESDNEIDYSEDYDDADFI